MGPALQLVLAFPCRRKRGVLLSPGKFDGQPSRGPVGAFSVVMFEQAAVRVLAHADVVGSVTTARDVAVMHLFARRKEWRRGELNPRPRSLATRRLHAYPDHFAVHP
jgi:hypothetical protein